MGPAATVKVGMEGQRPQCPPGRCSRGAGLRGPFATRAPAGEKLTMSYGPYSNDKLLMVHGALEDDNPFDVFIMRSLLDHLRRLHTISDGRIKAALRLVTMNPALRKARDATHCRARGKGCDMHASKDKSAVRCKCRRPSG